MAVRNSACTSRNVPYQIASSFRRYASRILYGGNAVADFPRRFPKPCERRRGRRRGQRSPRRRRPPNKQVGVNHCLRVAAITTGPISLQLSLMAINNNHGLRTKFTRQMAHARGAQDFDLEIGATNKAGQNLSDTNKHYCTRISTTAPTTWAQHCPSSRLLAANQTNRTNPPDSTNGNAHALRTQDAQIESRTPMHTRHRTYAYPTHVQGLTWKVLNMAYPLHTERTKTSWHGLRTS